MTKVKCEEFVNSEHQKVNDNKFPRLASKNLERKSNSNYEVSFLETSVTKHSHGHESVLFFSKDDCFSTGTL